MSFTVRDFTPTDYPHLVTHQATIYPDKPVTTQFFIDSDARRDPAMPIWRYVAEVDGVVVANAFLRGYGFEPSSVYEGRIMVLPAYRRRGIGAKLYEQLVEKTRALGGTALYLRSREDHPEGIRFIIARGHHEERRAWESWLHLDQFDPAPFRPIVEKVLASGIGIYSFSELAEHPEHLRQLHALENTVVLDVPDSEGNLQMSFEFWSEQWITNPDLSKESYFIALDGEDYVGLSNGFLDAAEARYYHTGLTGVHPDYRRRGIAFALKIRAAEWAKATGKTLIKTQNDATNVGMLAINRALGYVQQPAMVLFKREWD